MSKKPKKVIIIGSGFGGLAAASILAKADYDVTVLDKNDSPGGRAHAFEDKGYIFDRGPSWYLMPEVFEKFFAQFDTKPEDYYKLIELDPYYQVHFNDGMVQITSSLKHNMSVFDQFEKNGGKKLKEYLQTAKTNYDIFMKHFVYRSFDSPISALDPHLIRHGLRIAKLTQSYHHYVSKQFKSLKAQQILEYPALFLGNSPYNSPAIYTILSHTDMGQGVLYPEGGFSSVSKAIYDLATAYGATILQNQAVTNINVSHGSAKTVTTKQDQYKADIVISNADYAYTETQLLKKDYQTYDKSYWNTRVNGPSAILLFIGTQKNIPSLAHHTFYFSNTWKDHFDSIFKTSSMPSDPSFYLTHPSLTDSSIAPKNKGNIFVLIPTASNITPTKNQISKLSKHVIATISDMAKVDLAKQTTYMKVFTPKDFQSMYHSFQGSMLGLSHTLWQSAWFRPRHRSKKVNNLYYCGANTHPGVGAPTSLISGQIVAQRIMHEFPL